jgi:DNA-binding transcriptional regulator LsrR (DeoR family)
MYFLDSRSKSEIASEMGISRFKVARILDEARASGLVRIEISEPKGINTALSDRVRKTFGLREALVVEVDESSEAQRRRTLAQTATDLLAEIVTEDDVLGVGFGRTLTIMAETMDSLARCPVVQMTGALLGVNMDENSIELVRQISARNGGPAFPMYVPQVLSDAATAQLMRQQPEVAEAHRRFSSITKAVVAVGSWTPPNSQLYDALSPAERRHILKQGAVAEVCAALLDADGNAVADDFTARCISISADQLRAVDEVIAVAGGQGKALAVQSVLRGGLAVGLVTDVALATALLDRDGVAD